MFGPPSSPPAPYMSRNEEKELRSMLLPAFGHEQSPPKMKPREYLKPKFSIYRDENALSQRLQQSGFLPTPLPTSEANNNQTSSPIPSSPQQEFISTDRQSPISSPSVAYRSTPKYRPVEQPLQQLIVARIPSSGEIITIGRSSKSSKVTLKPLNRLASRVHAKVHFDSEENLIKIECLGWNGLNANVPQDSTIPGIPGERKTFPVEREQVLNVEKVDGITLDIHGDKVLIEVVNDSHVSDATEDELWSQADPTELHAPARKRVRLAVPAENDNKENIYPVNVKQQTEPEIKPVALAEKPVEKPTEKYTKSTTEKSTENLAKIGEEPTENPSEELVKKPTDQLPQTPVEHLTEKTEKSVENPTKETSENPEGALTEKLTLPTDRQTTQELAEKTEKPTEKPTEKLTDELTKQPTEKLGEKLSAEQLYDNKPNSSQKQVEFQEPEIHNNLETHRPVEYSDNSRASSVEPSDKPNRKQRRQHEELTPEVKRELLNVVANYVAFSRLSAIPFSSVRKANSTLQSLPKSQVRSLINEIACVGIITGSVEDTTGRKAEDNYYYMPEQDNNEERRQIVQNTKGHRSLRNCRKTHKQYFYRPLQLD